MSLIVTGSIGIDNVDTPTGAVRDVLGGSAIYFAAAASFFGPVRLVAAVGEDFTDGFLATLGHFGLDMSGLERRSGSRTFRWHGRYHQDMNRRDTVAVELNVLAEAPPQVPESYRDSQFVFLANTDPQSQMRLLEHFPKRTLAVADTMDIWISQHRDGLDHLLQRIDGLLLNDSEAVMLSGQTNMVRAAESILAMGPRFVVIKKGEHGALWHDGNQVAALPAHPASDVVDPTGAGDCFAGAMMGHLSQCGTDWAAQLNRAIAYGTVLASYNIESFSLERLKQISRADVEARFGDYCRMLSM